MLTPNYLTTSQSEDCPRSDHTLPFEHCKTPQYLLQGWLYSLWPSLPGRATKLFLSAVVVVAESWVQLFCDSMDWDFPGRNTGVVAISCLQGIFPTQGLNLHLLCLLHCRQMLYR